MNYPVRIPRLSMWKCFLWRCYCLNIAKEKYLIARFPKAWMWDASFHAKHFLFAFSPLRWNAYFYFSAHGTSVKIGPFRVGVFYNRGK